MTKEEQDELEFLEKRDRNRESIRTFYDCWVEDNIDDLRKDFCEQEEGMFKEFCEEAYDDRDEEYG